MTGHGSLLDPATTVRPEYEDRGTFAARPLGLLTLAVVVASAYVALAFVNQPLLEAHAFRQTHTALTAYWLQRNGFSLAYETPVAGAPWEIPFEAPIYESIVALGSSLTGASLSPTGRLTSWLFLLASAWPAFAIARRLKLERGVVLVFLALWFSSPLYLFWGRSFLMETAVVFFFLAGLPFGIDVVRGVATPRAIGLATFFFSLAMTQKPTAAAPVLLVVGLCWLCREVKRLRAGAFSPLSLVAPAFTFGVPLAAALAWTHFADGLKRQNAFGSQLTSSALHHWHFGTIEQRLSSQLYTDVYWSRLIKDNAGGLLGVVLILAALCVKTAPGTRGLVALCLVLFVLPPLMFANLHIVHTYYQVECGLFGAAALAIAIGTWLPALVRQPAAATLLTGLFVVINLVRFKDLHWSEVTARFPILDNRTLAVSEALKRYTPSNSAVVAFGFQWSSELAYYSERRSFTVPEFFAGYRAAWKEPVKYLGDTPLGAVVRCPTVAQPSRNDVLRRYWSERRWSYLEVAGCQLLFPARDHRQASERQGRSG